MTFDDLPEHERAMMLRTCLEAERELRMKEEGCSDMAGYKVKQTKDKKPKPIRADPEPTSKKVTTPRLSADGVFVGCGGKSRGDDAVGSEACPTVSILYRYPLNGGC